MIWDEEGLGKNPSSQINAASSMEASQPFHQNLFFLDPQFNF